MSSLPDGVFDDLARLVTLRLQDNQLTTLPDDIFAGMRNAQVNAKCSFVADPGLLGGLRRCGLQTINLSNNDLTTLPDISNFVSLTTLEVEDNKLMTLPDKAFSTLQLHTLKLQGNPGAPFALEVNLERVDEEGLPVANAAAAPSPAIVRANIPLGLPLFTFAFEVSGSAGRLSATEFTFSKLYTRDTQEMVTQRARENEQSGENEPVADNITSDNTITVEHTTQMTLSIVVDGKFRIPLL